MEISVLNGLLGKLGIWGENWAFGKNECVKGALW